MTISKIPYQEIAKRLKIDVIPVPADSRVNQTIQALTTNGDFMAGSALEVLPLLLLDRIVSFLDFATGINLTITSISFRCLIKENIPFQTLCTIRFFDLASLKLAELGHKRTLQLITREIAKRGDFERALKMAGKISNLGLRRKDDTYCCIAVEQAFKGDLAGAHATILLQEDMTLHLISYVLIARELAGRGDDANAVKIADLVPSDELEDKLSAYRAIVAAQVYRGSLNKAGETMQLLPHEHQPSLLAVINREQASYEKRSHARKNPNQIQDPEEKISIYRELAVQHAQEGDLQAALLYVLNIQDGLSNDYVYKEIARAQIRNGDLDAALHTVNANVQTIGWKDSIYELIAQEQAKRRDYNACLSTMDLIDDIAIRAEAYQQVVSVLYNILPT